MTCGTEMKFSTAYHPQPDCLAERMIKKEYMIGRYCSDGLNYYIPPNLGRVVL